MWMLKARPTPMLSVVWSPWAVQLQSWMEREVLGWLWSSVGGQQGCGGKAAWDACEGVNKLWEHKAAIWHLECQIQHCFSNLCLSDLFGLGGGVRSGVTAYSDTSFHVWCASFSVWISLSLSLNYMAGLNPASFVTALFSDKGTLTVQFWLQEWNPHVVDNVS